jgi:hypothetical protein
MLLRPPACLLHSLGLGLLTVGEVLQRILVDNPAGSRGSCDDDPRQPTSFLALIASWMTPKRLL